MGGGWCGEKNGGVNLHFSKLISPEYPSGKGRGSFLLCFRSEWGNFLGSSLRGGTGDCNMLYIL